MSTVGDNIKALRVSQGISQNKLAKRAGIAQATLSAIEASTKNPSVETVRLLASALGCKVSDLTEGKNIQEIHVDPLRESIIFDYDQLPPEAQQLVRQYIDLLKK